MTDNLFSSCKECTKSRVRANYNANFIQIRQYEAQRFKTVNRKNRIAVYQQEHRKNNPEKYKARTAVGNALRDGRLTKLPCCNCGDKKAQAHHHDYSLPLAVTWLCFKCHRMVHGQENAVK